MSTENVLAVNHMLAHIRVKILKSYFNDCVIWKS